MPLPASKDELDALLREARDAGFREAIVMLSPEHRRQGEMLALYDEYVFVRGDACTPEGRAQLKKRLAEI